MKDRLRCVLPGLVLALAGAGACAQQMAWTAKNVNLRAGPDRFYPVVAVLPPNAQVVVQGCLSDYRWCDVVFGYDRGWVYAGNLRMNWEGRVTPLAPVAPLVGIVIAPFVFDAYWGLHYRDRPWYPDRDRWVRPPPRFHPAPPPRFHAPPPRIHAPPPRIGPPPHPAPPPHVAPPARIGQPPGVHRPPPGVHAEPRPPGTHPGRGEGHREGGREGPRR